MPTVRSISALPPRSPPRPPPSRSSARGCAPRAGCRPARAVLRAADGGPVVRGRPPKALVLLLDDRSSPAGRVLLGRKRRGFGAGRVVAVGGGLEPGERPRAAAVRECREEVGVTPLELQRVALLDFTFERRPEWDLRALVYLTRRWRGRPCASEELEPCWYPRHALPLERMWPDARHWLPRLLAGERLVARFRYDADQRLRAGRLLGWPEAVRAVARPRGRRSASGGRRLRFRRRP